MIDVGDGKGNGDYCTVGGNGGGRGVGDCFVATMDRSHQPSVYHHRPKRQKCMYR